MGWVNRNSGPAFLALFGAFVVAVVAWDVHLNGTAPDGVNTISWSMAKLGASPIAVYFVGVACGGAFIGLPFHFWWGMPSPKLWDDYQAALKAQGAAEKRADELDEQLTKADQNYIRVLTERNEYKFALSDCQAGQRNEHGFPPGLPRLAPGTYPES